MLRVQRHPDKKNRPASLMTPDGFEFALASTLASRRQLGRWSKVGLRGDDRRQCERDTGDSRNDKAAEEVNLFAGSGARVGDFKLVTHLIVDPGNERNT